jgi:hypothetical protein
VVMDEIILTAGPLSLWKTCAGQISFACALRGDAFLERAADTHAGFLAVSQTRNHPATSTRPAPTAAGSFWELGRDLNGKCDAGFRNLEPPGGQQGLRQRNCNLCPQNERFWHVAKVDML